MTNALTNSMASAGSASAPLTYLSCSADSFMRRSSSFAYFRKDFEIQSDELTINLVNPTIAPMGSGDKPSPLKYQIKCYDASDNELTAKAYLTFEGSQDMSTGNIVLKLVDNGVSSVNLTSIIIPRLTGSVVKVTVDFSGSNVITTVYNGDTGAVLGTLTNTAISTTVAKLKLNVMLDVNSDWVSSNSVFDLDLLNSSIESSGLSSPVSLIFGNSL